MTESCRFSREELQEAMREGYSSIINFVTSPGFKEICLELHSLSDVDRETYIRSVILDKRALSQKGVFVPDGILLQRSSFGDRRPTLFCVKKYLPERFHDAWENVNLTFDAEFLDGTVSRDSKECWRFPIRPDIQSLLLAAGLRLDRIPSDLQVKHPFMGELVSSS